MVIFYIAGRRNNSLLFKMYNTSERIALKTSKSHGVYLDSSDSYRCEMDVIAEPGENLTENCRLNWNNIVGDMI